MSRRKQKMRTAEWFGQYWGTKDQITGEINFLGEAPSLPEKESKEALELLQNPSLLYRISEDIQRFGVAGEKRNALIVYLCLTSRILKSPISLLIKGGSSAGKSYLVKKVTQFFPNGAYKELTGMSKKALVYSTDSFSHRTIIIFEKEGMEEALYYIRTLQSEGKIVFETVIKDSMTGFPKTERIKKEGPINFIVTTTALKIHPENETRNWSIFMDEGVEQTRKVKDKIAEQYSNIHPDSSFLKTYQNVQWLLKSYPVNIPYANFLSERTPNEPLRMRRDFGRLLAGIEIVALLHQFQREKKEDNGIEYIEATLKDYFMATRILGPIFEESLLGTNQKTRRIIDAVFSLYEKNGENPVTLKDLEEELEISRDTAMRWIKPALENGEVEVQESKGKNPKTFTPGIRREDASGLGLPPVRELAGTLPHLSYDFFKAVDPITGRVVCEGEE